MWKHPIVIMAINPDQYLNTATKFLQTSFPVLTPICKIYVPCIKISVSTQLMTRDLALHLPVLDVIRFDSGYLIHTTHCSLQDILKGVMGVYYYKHSHILCSLQCMCIHSPKPFSIYPTNPTTCAVSPLLLPNVSIAFTTPYPSTTWPNTTWRPSNLHTPSTPHKLDLHVHFCPHTYLHLCRHAYMYVHGYMRASIHLCMHTYIHP